MSKPTYACNPDDVPVNKQTRQTVRLVITNYPFGVSYNRPGENSFDPINYAAQIPDEVTAMMDAYFIHESPVMFLEMLNGKKNLENRGVSVYTFK